MEWASLYSKCQFRTYPVDHPLKEMGTKNLVKQDNTSTIKMVRGGVRVCGPRTRSIHTRYLYATKRVKDGTIIIVYCPTKAMVADYLSKPLQGSFFCLHCNTLMGLTLDVAIQYQIDYGAEKMARAKLVGDHLSS